MGRWLLVSVLVWVWTPTIVLAQGASDEEAQALYTAGRVAYEEGRFDDALARFRESYELSGRAALLYNIGMAADRLRRDEEALRAFEQYLRAEPNAPHRASVENRVAALRRVIADRETASADSSAEPGRAPTAREAAEAGTDPQPSDAPPVGPTAPADPAEEEGSVLGSWWFWTAVGVVVAGGAVAAVLLSSPGDTEQEPIPGDYGVVVMTLGAR